MSTSGTLRSGGYTGEPESLILTPKYECATWNQPCHTRMPSAVSTLHQASMTHFNCLIDLAARPSDFVRGNGPRLLASLDRDHGAGADNPVTVGPARNAGGPATPYLSGCAETPGSPGSTV